MPHSAFKSQRWEIKVTKLQEEAKNEGKMPGKPETDNCSTEANRTLKGTNIE
jgi:hypothetical protein